MRRAVWLTVSLIALGAGFAAYWLFNQQEEPPPLVHDFVPPAPAISPPISAPTPAPKPAEPAILHPLADARSETPLPELEHSDAPILAALRAVLGGTWQEMLLPDALIRNVVATIDALPRQYLPARVVPIKRVGGSLITEGQGNELSIDVANGTRYVRHVALIEAVDSTKLVAVYRTFYPLFQRAYAELGYPNAYFNDRLIEAIDDLLAAPTPVEPLRLVQPKVLYRYADEKLEALSAGQKIMVRVGRDNAERLKKKLREIRQLVAQGTKETLKN